MRAKYKLFLLIMVPLFIGTAYLAFNLTHSFSQIKDTRDIVFVQSTLEVKYASDIQHLSALMQNQLVDAHLYKVESDEKQVAATLLRYREYQQRRYFALQKLVETVNLNESQFQRLYSGLDSNKESLVKEIQDLVTESNARDEETIALLAVDTRANDDMRLERNLLTNGASDDILTEKVSQFVEVRYLKVEKVSKALDEIEQNARRTLYINAFLTLLMGLMVVLFIEVTLIQPVEHMARAFETRDITAIDKLNSNLLRQDEIGFLMREVHDTLLGLNEERVREMQKKKRHARKSASEKRR